MWLRLLRDCIFSLTFISVRDNSIHLSANSIACLIRKAIGKKDQGIDTLIGLIASNEDAQRFYRNLLNAEIKDEGIWIDL